MTDVLVQSYRSEKLAQLDFEYEPASGDNDDVACCSLSGFGPNSPYGDRPATDGVAMAMSRLAGYTGGDEDGLNLHRNWSDQLWLGAALVDINTGAHASDQIAATLYRQATTGDGTHIDISPLDVAAFFDRAAGLVLARRGGPDYWRRSRGHAKPALRASRSVHGRT